MLISMTEHYDISKMIKKYRELNNVSMPLLASVSGISKESLYKWEKGTKPTDFNLVNKLKIILESDWKTLHNDYLNQNNLGSNNVSKNYLQHRRDLKNNQTKKLVPIYETEFTAGMIELIKTNSSANILGYINIKEFEDCDAVVTCKNNSMAAKINPGDWVGIRRIYEMDDIELGGIYGIVTKNFNLFKYINKIESDKYCISSENADYKDRKIDIDKVQELWVVSATVPFSQIKTYL